MEFVSARRRLAAWLIEFVVVLVLILAGLAVGAAVTGGSTFIGFVLAFTALWLYFAGFESSPAGTTLSGRLLGTRVTDLGGAPLTFGRATRRHFAMYFTALTPLAVGYWMVLWTKRRQTLHDWVAGTVVVRSR